MKFTIYHHNDFDGVLTAAIFAKFLLCKERREKNDIVFSAVDYDMKNKWVDLKLASPCAVVDFLYHHEADWWFDHHTDPFIGRAVALRSYVRSDQRYWSTKFLSCTRLVMAHFYRYFRRCGIRLKREYRELVRWSEIIDGAAYESPEDLFGFANDYININKTMGVEESEEYLPLIIDALYEGNIHVLTEHREFNRRLEIVMAREKEAERVIKEIAHVDDVVAIYDLSGFQIPFQRYIAYHLFPHIYYRVAIYRKNGRFSVSVNYNNWRKERNRVNLGKLCEHFGGGGRFNVGAVLADTHDDAIEIAEEIRQHLRRLSAEQTSFLPPC